MRRFRILLLLCVLFFGIGCTKVENVDISKLEYNPEDYDISSFTYVVEHIKDKKLDKEVENIDSIDDYFELNTEEKYYSMEKSLNYIVDNQLNGGYVKWNLKTAPKIIESNYPDIYKIIEENDLFYRDVFTPEEKTKWLMENDIDIETTDIREFINHLNYSIGSYDSWQLYSELREDLGGQISTDKYIEKTSEIFILENYLDIEKSLQEAINKQLNGAIIYWDEIVGLNIIKADYPKIYKQIEENNLLDYGFSEEELYKLLDINNVPRKLDISQLNYDLENEYPWDILGRGLNFEIDGIDELPMEEQLDKSLKSREEKSKIYDLMTKEEKYEYSNEYFIEILNDDLQSDSYGIRVDGLLLLKENYPHVYIFYRRESDDVPSSKDKEDWLIENGIYKHKDTKGN
ncbi:MAG: hypothetical protein GXZ08_05020 [Tissierellia bacterium]|nr:hypothetical protein [Tissierellia bacterium]